MIEEKLDQIIELLTTISTSKPVTAEPADEPEEDLAGGDEPAATGPTLADVQDAVRRAATANKDKTVKALAKFGAKRATDIEDESKFAAVIAELAKVK